MLHIKTRVTNLLDKTNMSVTQVGVVNEYLNTLNKQNYSKQSLWFGRDRYSLLH